MSSLFSGHSLVTGSVLSGPAPSASTDVREHRCAKCWGPYGKSAIRCPNEPEDQDNAPWYPDSPELENHTLLEGHN